MKIINWFVLSSKNSGNIALTMKGLIPFLVLFGFDEALITETSTVAVQMIMELGQIITLAITLYGFIRKIYYSFKK